MPAGPHAEANALATANLGLAFAAARQFAPADMDPDEAVSLGMLALVKASRGHDPARGTLGTLVFRCYRSLVAHWRTTQNRARRRGAIRNAPLGTRNPVDPRPGPADAVDAADEVAFVRRRLHSKARWALIEARVLDGESLGDIGRRLPGGPVTGERARQRVNAVLAKCRALLDD